MMKRTVLALFVLLSLAGCATTRTNTAEEVPPRHTVAEFRDQPFAYVLDPWEPFNRNMYRFNYYFDRYFFLPVVRGYEFVTPVYLQGRISNFYNNLGEIKNLTNSIFQLKGWEAAHTLGRFVTNSTLGVGGLYDPATKLGLERRPEDFGKTLGYWGAGAGPYLVLPLFGPSSVRDAEGLVVDLGIRYGVYQGIKSLTDSDDNFTVWTTIQTLGAVDARHQVTFRYYDSGYPFEYYLVRFLYYEKRDMESTKPKSSGNKGESR